MQIRASKSLGFVLFLIHIVLSGLNSFFLYYDIGRKRIFGSTAALSDLHIDRFHVWFLSFILSLNAPVGKLIFLRKESYLRLFYWLKY